jgi:hypothetical protein
LNRPITVDEIIDPLMMHDPTKVTDGIEIAPNDQIMAARRGAYLVSAAKRSGGWQACPFAKNLRLRLITIRRAPPTFRKNQEECPDDK